jgi:hypothetical protein
MTDRHEPPELSPHLLADLDAGVLDPVRAAEVRAAAAADPDADAALTALAATRRALRDLADPPVPPEIAARWDAALAAEAGDGPPEAGRPPPRGTVAPGIAPGSGSAAAERGAHPRRRPRPALLAAAVLAAVVAGAVFWGPRDPAPPPHERVDLVAEALAARGGFDVGLLVDPTHRAGCLRAAAPPGVPPEAALLGGRDVVLNGRAGVLLLLAGGSPGHLHVVVVDPACGPAGGRLLRALTIGG